MVMAPCILRCPYTNPSDMLHFVEIEKAFLRTIIEATPTSISQQINLEIRTRINVQGAEETYDGSGLEELTEEQAFLTGTVE